MYQNISSCLNGKLRRVSADVRHPTLEDESLAARQYDQSVGSLVLKLVSTLEKVKPEALLNSSRGRADICLSRQMAMYLMHTVFSCPYHRVAVFFKRDRTTISHACRLVEDLRDNEEFDKRLEAMENLLVSARALGELMERQRDDV